MEVNMAALDKPPIYISLMDGTLPQQAFHYLKESTLRFFGRSTETLPELIITFVPTKTIDNVADIDTRSVATHEAHPFAFIHPPLTSLDTALATTVAIALLAAAAFLWRAYAHHLANAQQLEQDELDAAVLRKKQESAAVLQQQQDNATAMQREQDKVAAANTLRNEREFAAIVHHLRDEAAAATLREMQRYANTRDAAKNAKIAELKLELNDRAEHHADAVNVLVAKMLEMFVEKDELIISLRNDIEVSHVEFQKQTTELGRLRKNCSALREGTISIKSMEAELKDSRKENQDLQDKQTLLRTELCALRKEKDEQQQGSMKELDGLNAALATKGADHTKMEALLAKKDQEQRDQMQITASKLSALESKLAEASERSRKSELAAKGAEDTVRALHAQNNALGTAKKTLEAANNDLAVANERSISAQGTLEQEIASALDAKANLEAALSAQESRRVELARVHALVLLRKDALEDGDVEWQSQVEKMQLQISALETDREELELEIEAMQEELNASKLAQVEECDSASSAQLPPACSGSGPGPIGFDCAQHTLSDDSDIANKSDTGNDEQEQQESCGKDVKPEEDETSPDGVSEEDGETEEGEKSPEDDTTGERNGEYDADKPAKNEQDNAAENDKEDDDAEGDATSTDNHANRGIGSASKPETVPFDSKPAGENKKKRKTRGKKPWVRVKEKWAAEQAEARKDKAGTTMAAVPSMALMGPRGRPAGPRTAILPMTPIRRRGRRDAPPTGPAVPLNGLAGSPNGPKGWSPPTGPAALRNYTAGPTKGSKGLLNSRWADSPTTS